MKGGCGLLWEGTGLGGSQGTNAWQNVGESEEIPQAESHGPLGLGGEVAAFLFQLKRPLGGVSSGRGLGRNRGPQADSGRAGDSGCILTLG